MKRKSIVPPNISAEWRTFGLPREVNIDFWNFVHSEMPENYENIRSKRDHENRGFRHEKVFKSKTGEAYLIVLFVDDTSSPEHLMLTEARCIRRKK